MVIIFPNNKLHNANLKILNSFLEVKNRKKPFNCQKCGFCCYFDPKRESKAGITLLKDEYKFFRKLAEKEQIDIRLDHRERGFFSYSSIDEPQYCFLFDKQNKLCKIYDKRPLYCKHYPLYLMDSNPIFDKIRINQSIIFSYILINTVYSCREINRLYGKSTKMNLFELYLTLDFYFPSTLLNDLRKLAKIYENEYSDLNVKVILNFEDYIEIIYKNYVGNKPEWEI